MKRVRIPASWNERDVVEIVNDDFTGYGNILTSGAFTSGAPAVNGWHGTVCSGSPSITAVMSGVMGGKLRMAAISGDNAFNSIHRGYGLVGLEAENPIEIYSRLQLNETVSGTGNLFVGVTSLPLSDIFRNDGAGIATSGIHVGISKLDGEQNYRGVAQTASGDTTTTLSTTPAGTKENSLLITVNKALHNPSKLQVSYTVDGKLLKDSNGNLIRHEITANSGARVTPIVELKNGDGNSANVVIDLVQVIQHRGTNVP